MRTSRRPVALVAIPLDQLQGDDRRGLAAILDRVCGHLDQLCLRLEGVGVEIGVSLDLAGVAVPEVEIDRRARLHVLDEGERVHDETPMPLRLAPPACAWKIWLRRGVPASSSSDGVTSRCIPSSYSTVTQRLCRFTLPW